MMFGKLKRFYNLHLYTAQQLHRFVDKGVITEEQYLQIINGE